MTDGCRYCEDQDARAKVAEAAAGDSGIVILKRLWPFEPTKMRCFDACCAACNSCHHYLCCACWKKGVRVDYKNKTFRTAA